MHVKFKCLMFAVEVQVEQVCKDSRISRISAYALNAVVNTQTGQQADCLHQPLKKLKIQNISFHGINYIYKSVTLIVHQQPNPRILANLIRYLFVN